MAGLSALTTLDLSDNLLTPTGLPARSFASLPALTSLDLSGNRLGTLPAGLFAGLTQALTSYDLRGQFNDSDDNVDTLDTHYVVLMLNLTGNTATVTIPTGAPEALSITLDLTGASSSTATVPIALGATSGTVTLTPVAGQTLGASLNTTLPTLSVSNTGLTLVTAAPGICTRAAGVQAALIATAAVTVSNCAAVTTTMLGNISGTLDLSSRSIASLQATDLADLDLSAITGLDLNDNSLTTMPAGIFTGFTAVTTLDLGSNQFATLPAGIFSGLTALTTLTLSGNQFATLPAGILSGLTALTTLDLSGNPLATLPAAIFSGLTALATIDLSGNQFTTLPSGTFGSLAALATIDLSGNQFTTLPSGIFGSLAALATIDLSDNQLATLPDGIFSGLAALANLDLTGNDGDGDGTDDPLALAVKLSSPASMQVQVDLPLPMAAAVTVYALTDTGTTHSITPGTPVTITDTTVNSVQIAYVCFDQTPTTATTGAGCTGIDSTADTTFKGVQLASGFALVLDAFPTFGNSQIDDQTYNLQVALTPLLLPQAEISLPPGGTAPSLTYGLSATIAAGSGAQLNSNSLPAGLVFTASTRTLTGTPTALGTYAMTYSATDNNSDTATLTFNLAVSDSGICTRTSALVTALLAHSAVTTNNCTQVTDAMLQAVTGAIDLSGASITALLSGDFAELTGLTALNLSDNSLTTLPASIFTGLSALTTLNLGDNQLTATGVPAGTFTPLAQMTSLNLSGNQFAALPDGLFTGLSVDLQTLDLSGQFRNTATPNIETFEVPLTFSLSSNVVTVTIATGAPRALTVGLLVEGGTQASSPTSVSIAVGTTTNTATLLPQSGATLVADLDRASPPGLPTTYSGLTFSTGATGGICGRSLLVRNALLAQVSATTCDAVNDNMLAGISTALDMSGMGISRLRLADLAGLDSVTALDLSGNSIAELPAGIFDDLGETTDLDLSGNSIAELPAGIFDDLDKITDLDLSGNQLATLPDDIFSALATLADLDLTGNSGAPFPLEVKLSAVAAAVSSVSQSVSPASAGNPFQMQAIVPTATGMTQVRVDLPLPLAAAVTVYAQTDTGNPHTIAPGTPITITDTAANSVQILNVCFDQTPAPAHPGTGCTGIDATADATFKGVQLTPGFVLIVDAFPTFDEQITIANQMYLQQVAITPLQLPQAGLTLPPGGTAPSLTYSLTATVTTGDGALLDSNDLPAGLAFSAATRTLRGTPTALGTYAMTYSVADNNGDTDDLTFDVQVSEVPADFEQLHAQILSHFAISVADSASQAVSDRIDRMISGQKPRFSINKDNSDFELPLASKRVALTIWGQGNRSDLALTAGDWTWNGDINGEQIGFDWRSANSTFIIGTMTQSLRGLFHYAGSAPGAQRLTGYYRTPMDSEHYYIGWAPRGSNNTSWINFWAMNGTGTGSVTLGGKLGGGLQTDTYMDMSHFGISLVPLNNSRGLRLRLRAESSTASLNMTAAQDLQPLELEVTRQRVLIEPSTADMIRGDHQQLVVTAEIGARSDSTTIDGVIDPDIPGLPIGEGTEYGLKLHYSWRNFDLQMGARQLQLNKTQTQERGEYEEDGYYLSLTLGSRSDERGWTASLRPSWGNTGSSIDRLWQSRQVTDLAPSGSGSASGSMEAEFSYGMLAPFGSSGLFIPYSKLHTNDSGATSATLGVDLSLNSGWQLNWQYSDSNSASRSAIDNNDSGEFKLGAKLSF